MSYRYIRNLPFGHIFLITECHYKTLEGKVMMTIGRKDIMFALSHEPICRTWYMEPSWTYEYLGHIINLPLP